MAATVVGGPVGTYTVGGRTYSTWSVVVRDSQIYAQQKVGPRSGSVAPPAYMGAYNTLYRNGTLVCLSGTVYNAEYYSSGSTMIISGCHRALGIPVPFRYYAKGVTYLWTGNRYDVKEPGRTPEISNYQ